MKSGSDFIFSVTRAAVAISIGGLLFLLCVVPSDSPKETFHLKHALSSDTVPPWGEIIVVFSEPLKDSGLAGFTFEPSFYSYALMWNTLRDTAVLKCIEPLHGRQRYVLRLKEAAVSENGAKIDPSSDSIVFFTYAAEQEPNGAPSIADTLVGRCFGSIATVDDTDMYVIFDTSAYALFLHSAGSQTSFTLKNRGDSTTAVRPFRKNDTLITPEKFKPPVIVEVYSYYRSVGGYYEIGYIGR